MDYADRSFFCFHGPQPFRVQLCASRPLSLQRLASSHFSKSSSPARSVALTTALISVTRSFPSSSSRMPSIVQPAGVVTASFNSAGWSPVSSTTLAEPFIVCAASNVATSRGRPTLTPASASDSKMMYTNAGPLAESPVTAPSASRRPPPCGPPRRTWRGPSPDAQLPRVHPGKSPSFRSPPPNTCWASPARRNLRA